jgi:hypothetical protein
MWQDEVKRVASVGCVLRTDCQVIFFYRSQTEFFFRFIVFIVPKRSLGTRKRTRKRGKKTIENEIPCNQNSTS